MLTTEQLDSLRRSRVKGRNRLVKAREIAGLTQVDVEAKTGLTQSYISRLERGDYTHLSLKNARKFTALYGCNIDDLFPAEREAVA